MQTYNSVNNQFSYQISIPQDGVDPVSDFTVNNAFKANSNSAHTILNYLTNYKPSIRVRCQTQVTSTASIQIYPFTDLFVDNGNGKIVPLTNATTANLTSTSLNPPGDFAVGSNYYIYAYGSSTTANFEISLVEPDVTRNFKNGDITRRYICCFTCINYLGSSTIRGFTFLNGKNTLQSPGLTTFNISTSGSVQMVDDIFVPTFCSSFDLFINVNQRYTGATSGYQIQIGPYPNPPITSPITISTSASIIDVL